MNKLLKYSKLSKENDSKKGWTNWIPLTGIAGQNDCFYRTNERKTQVQFVTDGIRAESCCHKEDEFNLYFGIQIAYLRCKNKALKNKKDNLERQLKDIKSEIADNNVVINNKISSLWGKI